MNITNIIFEGSLKIVAAIFSDGNYFIKMSDQNTNGPSFAEFIKELIKFVKSKKYYSGKRFCWMLDNVRFHKSKEVMSVLKEKFQGVCFIPPYTPQFAAIELFFNIIKSRMKVMTFDKTLKLGRREANKIVRDVIRGVTPQSIISWFKCTFRKMSELFKLSR